jgi:hypothetical protein
MTGMGSDGKVNPNFKNEAARVFEKATGNTNENDKVEVGNVNDRLLKEAKNNEIDLEGYKHSMDVYGVRHTLKNHGNAALEEKRGQVAITKSDIQQIPDVIYNYDGVSFSGKNKVGRETVTYTKKMPDGTTVYIEEIRSGNRELTLNTMRKHKNKK